MARKLTAHAALTPVPLLPHETLYVGVDIGKVKHVVISAKSEQVSAPPVSNRREG